MPSLPPPPPGDTPIREPLGFGAPLVEASFVARPHQLVVEARLGSGEVVRCHMPDRGRLEGVLVPDRPLLLAHRPAPHKKTDYQAVAAVLNDDEERLASLDTHLPNRLVWRALHAGAFEPAAAYPELRREVRFGASRFDFVLSDPQTERRLVLEVKSVGRIDPDAVARFPDAPTSRGRRHVEELGELCLEPGTQAGVLFVVQGAAASVAVDHLIDPELAAAVAAAREAGVHFWARRCALGRDGLVWGEALETA